MEDGASVTLHRDVLPRLWRVTLTTPPRRLSLGDQVSRNAEAAS